MRGAIIFLMVNIALAIALFFEASKVAIGIAVFLLIEGFVFYFWVKKKESSGEARKK